MDQKDLDALLNDGVDPPEQPGSPLGASPADTDDTHGASTAPDPIPPVTAPDEPALDSLGQPMNEFATAMAAAIAEEQAGAAQRVGPADLPLQEAELPSFAEGEAMAEATQPVSMLHDVQLHVKIELGRTHMFIEDVLRLGEGSVVELDRLAGDPVDVYVNGRLVARGEVLVLNDNFCVRISEIVSNQHAKMVG